jgi:RNA polymerase sigma-70 factor, ECF subfamily
MSIATEGNQGSSSQLFATFREQFGFVPRLFQAQAASPRLLEAEAAVISSILFADKSLSRAQKECILLVSSAARGNAYCFALHFEMLRLLGVPEQRVDRIATDYQHAKLTAENAALVQIALKLASSGDGVSRADVREAASHGLPDECLLEGILTAALGGLLCTIATGTGVAPDFAPREIRSLSIFADGGDGEAIDGESGFYLCAPELAYAHFPPFLYFQEQYGSVPAVFRAQTLRPDVLEAEAFALRCLLEGTGSEVEQARVKAGFDCFFSVLEAGLGADPVFSAVQRPLRGKTALEKAHLSSDDFRLNQITARDPDAECVGRIKRGDLNSFEELMNRHSRAVYRTLVGLLGDRDEARDALQDTFLKAFQHLDGFEGRSKFSTWLVSIAIRTGIQRLRDRRPTESLDETGSDDGFRPRQLQAWTDDPERLYSRTETRSLIENSVMRLPAKYRVVLMLRDLEQLPIEEAASALGLGLPAVKARLLRGRLMLRESLAPHFASPDSKGRTKGVAL